MPSILQRFVHWLRGRRKPSPPAGPDQWLAGRFEHPVRPVDYRLFVPGRGADARRPLLVMLHGCKQDPDDFAAGTRMNQLASEHGWLVLYPAQVRRANVARCWNWFLPAHQTREGGEPALIADLVREVITLHAADPDRVYVAGLSAGGAMAAILARTHADLFAAVGVHSGLPDGAANDLISALAAMKQGCQRARTPGSALPTFIVHGDADTTVHPRNGEALLASALAAHDERRLQLDESPQPVPGSDRRLTRRTWHDAAGRPVIAFWHVHGAGHAWSGGSPAGSFTDPAGPDAARAMVEFFGRQRRAA